MSTEERNPPGRMIERIRERKEHHKQRGKIYRAAWVVGGVIVILVGGALSLPGVPGPGLLLVLFGLGMLALEFDRAERLLEKILGRVEHVVDQAQDAPRWQQILGGVVTVVAMVAVIAAFVLWDVPVLPG
jgi:uncharacterized protein (TIGR02611 family)